MAWWLLSPCFHSVQKQRGGMIPTLGHVINLLTPAENLLSLLNNKAKLIAEVCLRPVGRFPQDKLR